MIMGCSFSTTQEYAFVKLITTLELFANTTCVLVTVKSLVQLGNDDDLQFVYGYHGNGMIICLPSNMLYGKCKNNLSGNINSSLPINGYDT